MLPHFVYADLRDVLADLAADHYAFQPEWFAPHVEFRFPVYGSITLRGIHVELRQALEPWYVLGEEPGGGGTTRYVDSSVERMQIRVRGLVNERFAITCNGRRLPLQPTGTHGDFVCGVRYRAWQPPRCLHPTIPVHTPLVFDVLDIPTQRSIGWWPHPQSRNYPSQYCAATRYWPGKPRQ